MGCIWPLSSPCRIYLLSDGPTLRNSSLEGPQLFASVSYCPTCLSVRSRKAHNRSTNKASFVNKRSQSPVSPPHAHAAAEVSKLPAKLLFSNTTVLAISIKLDVFHSSESAILAAAVYTSFTASLHSSHSFCFLLQHLSSLIGSQWHGLLYLFCSPSACVSLLWPTRQARSAIYPAGGTPTRPSSKHQHTRLSYPCDNIREVDDILGCF